MNIVTSGAKYIDIDAYAGCVAYAELLRLQGKQALSVSTAPLNESVSQSVRAWKAPLHTVYNPNKEDGFVLIDISEPEQFDSIVDLVRVTEVIDHHPGFEEYWQEKIGDKAVIEFIGAACTLIYESWQKSGLVEKMSTTSARLLIYGILDNTLNFGAKVTTRRDIDAYEALLKIAYLPDTWTSQYFIECQNTILQDVPQAIQNDTKILSFQSFGQPMAVGQLVLWEGDTFLSEYQKVIQQTLSSVKTNWFMNLVNVHDRKSYFLTDTLDVQEWLSDLLGVQFDGQIAVADRLWLRKEIMKQNLHKD